jgi:hypothetical protein
MIGLDSTARARSKCCAPSNGALSRVSAATIFLLRPTTTNVTGRAGETHVGVDDYAIALTHIGRGISELRRHVRPLARDVYHRLSPEVRIAGGRYGVPAAAVAAAAAASAVIAAIE